MKLTRRTALFGGGAGLVALVAGGALFSSQNAYVKHVIRSHFRPGEVSEDDLDLFAEDFARKRPEWNALKFRLFGRLGSLAELTPIAGRPGIVRLREDALSSFILGSNCMTRVDLNEPLEYLYFPDPYEAGCVLNWSPNE
ncbi:MAG: hypothetical protein AAGD47_10710 [Pseudomonadota bacterium]